MEEASSQPLPPINTNPQPTDAAHDTGHSVNDVSPDRSPVQSPPNERDALDNYATDDAQPTTNAPSSTTDASAQPTSATPATHPMPDKQPDGPIKFQLIPISDVPGRPAIGDVLERTLSDNHILRIGRQVVRDGQPTVKGNKPATDVDIWFTSKVVSRLHAEMWVRDQQLYIKDIGSSSGTFLNKLRLSPAGKESRPYPIKEGDIIQFGVDYKGKADSKTDGDLYRCMVLKIGFFDQSWLKRNRKTANTTRFTSALKSLLAATNPYGTTSQGATDGTSSPDCCICIGEILPYQALFIAPCSHCYHYKCVSSLLMRSPMFQCPLCRQVANLTASVSTDSLDVRDPGIPISEVPDTTGGQRPGDRSTVSEFAGHVSERLRVHAVLDNPTEGVPVTSEEAGSADGSTPAHPTTTTSPNRSTSMPKSHTFASGLFSARRASQIQQDTHTSGTNPDMLSPLHQQGSSTDTSRRRRSMNYRAEQFMDMLKFGSRRASNTGHVPSSSNPTPNDQLSRRGSNDPPNPNRVDESTNETDGLAISPTINTTTDTSTPKRDKRRTLSLKFGSFLRYNVATNMTEQVPVSQQQSRRLSHQPGPQGDTQPTNQPTAAWADSSHPQKSQPSQPSQQPAQESQPSQQQQQQLDQDLPPINIAIEDFDMSSPESITSTTPTPHTNLNTSNTTRPSHATNTSEDQADNGDRGDNGDGDPTPIAPRPPSHDHLHSQDAQDMNNEEDQQELDTNSIDMPNHPTHTRSPTTPSVSSTTTSTFMKRNATYTVTTDGEGLASIAQDDTDHNDGGHVTGTLSRMGGLTEPRTMHVTPLSPIPSSVSVTHQSDLQTHPHSAMVPTTNTIITSSS